MESANSVYVQRTFECKPETLFEWLTKPELIAQWFGPEGFSIGKITNTLEEGDSYQIELKKGGNVLFEIYGEYLKIQKPAIIKFTYQYNGLENPPPPSIVQFELSESGSGQTTLSMVQTFEVETPDFASRTKAWNYMLDKLGSLIQL